MGQRSHPRSVFLNKLVSRGFGFRVLQQLYFCSWSGGWGSREELHKVLWWKKPQGVLPFGLCRASLGLEGFWELSLQVSASTGPSMIHCFLSTCTLATSNGTDKERSAGSVAILSMP